MEFISTPHQKILRKTALLKDLTDTEFKMFMEYAYVVHYSIKQTIIKEGDTDNSLYFILEGDVRVYRKQENGQEVELGRLTQGDFFGELSLLDQNPRSASISAFTDAVLFKMEAEDFLGFTAVHPSLLYKVLKAISIRFRISNENYYKSIKQKNEELIQLHAQRTNRIAHISHDFLPPLKELLMCLTDAEKAASTKDHVSSKAAIHAGLKHVKTLGVLMQQAVETAIATKVESESVDQTQDMENTLQQLKGFIDGI